MAAMKLPSQEILSQQQSQKESVKKGRGRPRSRQQRKSTTKDENNNKLSQDENKIPSPSSKVLSSFSSSSPFSQINGESNRRSQRKSKEPTPSSKSTPAPKKPSTVTPKPASLQKKRKSPSSTEAPAKRRKRTAQKSPKSRPSEPEDLAPEEQNWIPIGKPWAEMVSIGSSPSKKAVCCFPAIKHKTENITFNILDVISVAAGEEEDGDNIGKIDRIFFDKKLGMCANVLWYYKYGQCNLNSENRTKIERKYNFDSRELIASKHTDTISCDSIQAHAFVLTFSEYCRYIAENKYDSLPSSLQSRCKELWPGGESSYPRRRFLPHEDTPQDSVYFCRKYYSLARKGIYSSAPLPTVAQKRQILKSRPFNQLLTTTYYCDSDNNYADIRENTP